MPPATASNGRYQRRETKGQIEEIRPDGLKIAGVWWENSKRQPVDLSPFHLHDGVYVAASETLDGERRWITEIELVQARRLSPPTAPYQFIDDWPDAEAPDETAPTARQYIADRLDCLRIAASLMTPGWVKKGLEPDEAVLFGVADKLLDWLYRTDDDR